MKYSAFFKAVRSLWRFVRTTDFSNGDDVKRTNNYLSWVCKHSELVQTEQNFSMPEKFSGVLRRGSVVWVDFGFNVQDEFGGRHPAIILSITADLRSMRVLPVDSGISCKDCTVKIWRVWGYKNIDRYCDVRRVTSMSTMRIDYSDAIGYVDGGVLKKIDKAINLYYFPLVCKQMLTRLDNVV